MIQLSHPYITTGKTIALTRRTFVSKVTSLLFNVLSRLVRWRRQWQPTPVHLPGKSHGQRSLVGRSPWGREESDTTERLHFHALEKEMATHSSVLAWRIPGTAGLVGCVYGVAQSWTRLKRRSSSSSSRLVRASLIAQLVKNLPAV